MQTPLKIDYSPSARDDLFTIWAYIAADNRRAADDLLQRFDQIFRELADRPFMGRQRDDLLPGTRSFPNGRYVIFYLPSNSELLILRVLSAFRKIDVDMFD